MDQCTLTVSLMPFAMGVGSRLSRFIRGPVLDVFLVAELLLLAAFATDAALAYFLSAWTTSLAAIFYRPPFRSAAPPAACTLRSGFVPASR